MDSELFRSSLGWLATAITFGVFLSPRAAVASWSRVGSVGRFSSWPYVSCALNCAVQFVYGVLRASPPLVVVNAGGCVLNAYYVVQYVVHASSAQRDDTRRQLWLAFVVLASALLWLLVSSDTHEQKAERIGTLAIVLCVVMFASPLVKLKEVIDQRSTESMDMRLSLACFACTVAWSAYGALIGDQVVLLPNLVGCALSLVQLLLFYVYPSPPSSSAASSSAAASSNSSASAPTTSMEV